MSRFFKKDPVEKAKKYVEKALREIEANDFEYASIEYEKAAKQFVVAGRSDFAVKYFREAAFCAIEEEDYIRSSEMKICAAETLLLDSRFSEAGGFYSEASDQVYRMKKTNLSFAYLSSSIMCNLAARNFETAVNLFKKVEKRSSGQKHSSVEFASICTKVLADGESTTISKLKKASSKVKITPAEEALIQLLTESMEIALQTEIVIEWAGKPQDEVSAKIPIEFELRYSCPVPVRVTNHRYSLSNSLTFEKEPQIEERQSEDGSWLLTVNPVLSGDGTIGPFKLTLEGNKVLMHKHSNKIDFRIAKAPADLKMDMTPERISCDLGDEVVFDIEIRNEGAGPADNILMMIVLSDGLELSLGTEETVIQYLGSQEKMPFHAYVRGLGMGDELVTVILKYPRTGFEITRTGMVRVG